jgi:arginyl-tRNA--protein-N-Asp/Glu arginylyltransferase
MGGLIPQGETTIPMGLAKVIVSNKPVNASNKLMNAPKFRLLQQDLINMMQDPNASEEKIELFVKNNPSVLTSNEIYPETLIAYAALFKKTNMVEILIEQGANIKSSKQYLEVLSENEAIKLIEAVEKTRVNTIRKDPADSGSL